MLLIWRVPAKAAVIVAPPGFEMARSPGSFWERSRGLRGRKTAAGCIVMCLQNQANIK